MTESESVALPLGDAAINGWDRWIRTTGMTESKSAALPLGYTPVCKKAVILHKRI